jgi:HD-GYP domain-containing protein (c-di-GMP phosphodiesterase class II)
MPRSLKLYIAGVVVLSAIALVAATLVFEPDRRIALHLPFTLTGQGWLEVALGIGFWTVLTFVTSALPVRLPLGSHHAVSMAPIIAAMTLGGPAVGGWVALIGTTEMRELRGRIPWYGTLANHAGILLPAIVGGVVRYAIVHFVAADGDVPPLVDFVAVTIAAVIYFLLNTLLASGLLAIRTGQSLATVIVGDSKGTAFNNLALAPLGWLMSIVYSIQWWAALLFALPLYTTRMASQRFVEMREMFTQTIGALAEAVDKRDPFTARHSHRVKEIAVDIGLVMRVSDSELEALEWGGLLHDVGKIGVPDNVLLKQERLTREERMMMNAHPVLGAQIIAPVTKLAPELPIIRHHHEWYNGSGYPDRLIGDEIPKLARVLHVADAFEAMTAARPYRMTPLTAEQALAELRKFAGVQFDPIVVDAFVRTHHVDGVADPGRRPEPRQIPLIAQAANSMSTSATLQDLPAATANPGSPTAPSPAAAVKQV